MCVAARAKDEERSRAALQLGPEVGRVRRDPVTGAAFLDELGLSVRLAMPVYRSPELARILFPLIELVPGEERPDEGAVHLGLPVFAVYSQAELAKQLNLTTRQVQNLEVRGMPSIGTRKAKRYPIPHVHIWYRAWTERGASGRSVRRVPFEVALAEHELLLAESNVRAARRDAAP